MYAVEFQTTIKNGKIEVPEMYRQQLKKRVRVILLYEERIDDDQPSIATLLADAPGQQLFQTANDVDDYLQQELESWD